MNLKAPIQRLGSWQTVRRLYKALSTVPLVGSALRRLARGAIPTETRVWLHISDGLGKGLWAHLDPRYETIYAEGRYEPPIQRVLSLHLQPGSIFYDVGAHIGIVSMFGAQLVGTNGFVFAFEADPDNARRIEENLSRNSLRQIRVIPTAVWSSGGRIRFERASAQSSRNQGAIATDLTASGEKFVEVEAVALDEFVRENPLPTLIKIDVEGAEADVLRGSEEVFARAKPVLICEVHHGKAAEDVTRWLLGKGYVFEWLEEQPQFPRHLLARWQG
jgi:FkbM family methyltransferase